MGSPCYKEAEQRSSASKEKKRRGNEWLVGGHGAGEKKEEKKSRRLLKRTARCEYGTKTMERLPPTTIIERIAVGDSERKCW